MAAHESPRITKLYDRTGDEITLDEVERITTYNRFQITLNARQCHRRYPNTVRRGRIRFKPIWGRY
jgi:hypothetical protein